MPRLRSDDLPLSPYRVIAELGQAIDRANAIVTHDSGNPRDQLLPFYEALAPRGYLGWGKSTQLGYGRARARREAGRAVTSRGERHGRRRVRDGRPDVEIVSRGRSAYSSFNTRSWAATRSMPTRRAPSSDQLTGDYTAVTPGSARMPSEGKPGDIAPATARARCDGRPPAVLEFITRVGPGSRATSRRPISSRR